MKRKRWWKFHRPTSIPLQAGAVSLIAGQPRKKSLSKRWTPRRRRLNIICKALVTPKADLTSASRGAQALAYDERGGSGRIAYAAPYIYHPLAEQNATLAVNLATPADLTSFTIFGRTDCCATATC